MKAISGDERRVEDLPQMMAVINGAITCLYCRRKWKAPADGWLNLANYDYLCDHIDDHKRVQARPTDNPPSQRPRPS